MVLKVFSNLNDSMVLTSLTEHFTVYEKSHPQRHSQRADLPFLTTKGEKTECLRKNKGKEKAFS